MIDETARQAGLDSTESVALFRHLPGLRDHVPWCSLGRFPTPIERLSSPSLAGSDVFVKREDLSSPIYGGNKIRTIECHIGKALSAGARRIWATGAYGSNHATATALQAPRAGLDCGVMLFPQPPSQSARDNLRALIGAGPTLIDLHNVVALPFAMAAIGWKHPTDYIMTPGGANTVGTFGHVSAGLEIAEQVAAGEAPPPSHIVLAVGSTCTTAGLLVGLNAAAKLGIAFGPGRSRIPQVTAVRVTPWPITDRHVILRLARKTADRLERLAGPRMRIASDELAASLVVEPRYLGRGYGRPAASTRGAVALMRSAGGPELDLVYSGKAAACLFELASNKTPGPLLFWATKSTAPLPIPTDDDVAGAPAGFRRWLARPVVT